MQPTWLVNASRSPKIGSSAKESRRARKGSHASATPPSTSRQPFMPRRCRCYVDRRFPAEGTVAMPRVSIVVGTYNAAAFIEATIASILGQTYRDFELIVVDDASSDDTVSRIAAFGDSRIRLIRNPTNIGVANTRNVGTDAATGEYIAMNE